MSEEIDKAILRDRLANERTLLAWLRTGLAFMALGLVLARFAWLAHLAGVTDPDSEQARIVGAVLVTVGALASLIGADRTRAYARIIDPKGQAPKNRVLYVGAVLVSFFGIALAVQIAIT
ncbi:MAG: DUF202 domain-containing protein [Polyangiaceae bacterium]|nr:DUF202 domain-containing protein [Polyangiaceae bacterium]